MTDFAQARRTMVDSQIRTFDVTDRALLAAMDEVPRERFMPAGQESFAYSDGSAELPLQNGGRALLAPMVLARMIQALEIEAGQRVLDVAGGGGYSAAILARLGAEVVALEVDGVEDPAPLLAELGLDRRVTARSGSLRAGCPDLAPFDAVLVNGAVEDEPSELLDQLADGGRLACMMRDGRSGRARLYVKSKGALGHRPLFDAAAPALVDFDRPRGFVF